MSLQMWVVYRRPRDYPDGFVVRRQLALRGLVIMDSQAQYAPDLEAARALVPPGLHRMERMREDDQAIAEVWL